MGPPRLGECVDGYAMAIRTSLLPSLLHEPAPPSGSARAAGMAARGGSPLPTAHRTIPVTGVIEDASMGKGARHPRRGGERWAGLSQPLRAAPRCRRKWRPQCCCLGKGRAGGDGRRSWTAATTRRVGLGTGGHHPLQHTLRRAAWSQCAKTREYTFVWPSWRGATATATDTWPPPPTATPA